MNSHWVLALNWSNIFLQVGLDRVTSQTYRNLLAKLPQGPVVLSAAYEAIEKKIKQVSYEYFSTLSFNFLIKMNLQLAFVYVHHLRWTPVRLLICMLTLCVQMSQYVDEWLCYQSLWDLQGDTLNQRLGDSVTLWMQCLNDCKSVTTRVHS